MTSDWKEYKINDTHIKVKLAENTIWLSAEMISQLFGVRISNIKKYIKTFYDDNELNEYCTSRKFIERNTNNISKYVTYYNLDVVVALCYRLNCENAIEFRKWVTEVLEDNVVSRKKQYKKRNSSLYYVAYLDMLGTKAILKKDNNDKYLNDLNIIYQNAIEQVKINLKDYKNNEFFIKIFSDNILIAVSLDRDEFNKEKLERLINLAGYIQVNALKYGYFLRGGIAKGSFYKNDIFVHGKALIDAVVLEEQNAIYPRVIIDRKEVYNTNKLFLNNDFDDFYYINYYYFSKIENYDNFKTILLSLLAKNRNNDKVKQKIMWAINYHNKYFNFELNNHLPQNPPIITKEEIIKVLNNKDDDNEL